ncbi:MAG: HNH endonuclease [Clostridiales bacterium]|nr:HNH endonuclease [Clostridiales bacterium]
MLKACSRCGRIHAAGQCTVKAEKKARNYDRSDNEAYQFRQRAKWRKKSMQIRTDAQYLCEVCRDKKKLVYEGLSVHHITPLSEDTSIGYEDTNLICLCSQCHELAEAGMIDRDYLRKLATLRISRKR